MVQYMLVAKVRISILFHDFPDSPFSLTIKGLCIVGNPIRI